jgi:hypothetical protein
VGALDRLNLVRRIKFSPEQANADRMNCLVDRYMERKAPCMVMMLHSTSLSAGYSPYAADQAQLESLYRNFEVTCEYCLGHWQMTSSTMSDFARLHTPSLVDC